MLLPVAAVAAAGLVTFRLSISALEEFRREIVEESDPATGKQFVALSALIDRRPAPPDELAENAPDSRPYRGHGRREAGPAALRARAVVAVVSSERYRPCSGPFYSSC